MALSQERRQGRIRLALGSDTVVLLSFQSIERLSEPFLITAEVHSESSDIDFLPHLGLGVGIDVYDDAEVARTFHGVLVEASFIQFGERGYVYRLTIRPWFWLLSHTLNYQIFQNVTVVDVLTKLFQDLGFTDFDTSRLGGTPPTREYCVQFGESAFSFASRLMEEEGIYYFFEHTKDNHTLILCDGVDSHEQTPDYEELPYLPPSGQARRARYFVSTWSEQVSTGAYKVSLRDFNFTRPGAPVAVDATAGSEHAEDTLEVYDYPGRYQTEAEGQPIAQHQLQRARAERRVFRAEAEAPALALGQLFKLSAHEVGRYNDKYLTTLLTYELVNGDYTAGGGEEPSLRLTFEATPSETPFRPARATRKPVARGPQTAIVTGPSGQTIHVDKYGRVKLHFHWDRLQPLDENCSCWVRVAEGWAGAGFGTLMPPRIGQEVIVDFLDGDPDRPIITGRVYNQDRMPQFSLPDQRTRAYWRSQTVGETGSYPETENPPSGVGYNQIYLEDAGGKEEISVHAQRDMNTHVRFNVDTTVGHNETRRIGWDRTTNIKRHETKTVEEGDETHTVKLGKRTTTVEMDETLTVNQGNMATTVKMGNKSIAVDMGNMSTKLKMGNYTVNCDLGAVTIEAMQSITLKVGQSSVVVDQMGVTIKGMMVTSEAQIQNTTKGLMTQVEGSAMTTVKGGIVMIN